MRQATSTFVLGAERSNYHINVRGRREVGSDTGKARVVDMQKPHSTRRAEPLVTVAAIVVRSHLRD